MCTRGGAVDGWELVGTSSALKALRKEIERVAPTPANVLITGESGTGKRHVARLLHQLSRRNAAPFLTVNCCGVPDALLASELFGHTKGSFAGAYRDKPGMLTLLDGGTMCLGEPAAMSARTQAKLLQFLATGELWPVGGAVARASHVRVVTTTTQDLAPHVAIGSFRADLLYRLRVVQLHVPPLRARREDIAALVEYWLSTAADFPFHGAQLSTRAMEMLYEYSWPGNVRELRNAVEWAVIHATSRVIDIGDFPVEVRLTSGG